MCYFLFFSEKTRRKLRKLSISRNNTFIISRIQTCFPSEVEIDKNEVYTVGGLILVKLKRKNKSSCFKGKINLSYKDHAGKYYQQHY